MRKFLIIGGVVIAFVLMAVMAKNKSESAVEMRIEDVIKGKVAKSVMASGYINYRQNVALRTEVTGQIKEILVEEGQRVKAGDPLLIVDRTVFQAAVNQYEAIHEMRKISIKRQEVFLAQLEVKLKRQRTLYQKNVVGKAAFENIERDTALARVDLKSRKSELKQSKATYDQALDKLKKTIIRAPIDGIVTGLNAKLGETVVEGRSTMVGSSLLNVSDPSEIIAEVNVEEAGILAIQKGQMSEITTAADPDGFEVGIVTHIGTTARKVGNNNNSFLVKLHLANSSPEHVRLGLSCRAEIFTESVENAVNIPVEAILYEKDDDKSAYVFLQKKGVAVKTAVTIGIQTDSRAEILTGVDEGDKLIAGPYRMLKTLRDGQNVEKMDEKKKKKKKSDEDDGDE